MGSLQRVHGISNERSFFGCVCEGTLSLFWAVNYFWMDVSIDTGGTIGDFGGVRQRDQLMP